MANESAQRRWRNGGFVAPVLYTLITLGVLWPLLNHFSSAVPGAPDSDFYQFHWGYWWLRFAILNGQSPLWTDYVLYPHVTNLSYHTLAPIWLPVYWLLEPLIGRVAAGNVLVLLGFPLSGSVMYAWLRRQIPALPAEQAHNRAASLTAFLGGLLFAFSPFMLDHAANMHLNLTTLWWFPLTLLLWDEIAFPRRLPRWITATLLGLALWGLWLTDLQYPLWLPFTLGCYGLWTLWARRQKRAWLPLVGWGALALAVMAVLLLVWPLPALLQLERDANEFPPAGLNTVRAYALPPEALLGLAPNVADRTLGRALPWLAWGAVVLGVWTRIHRGVQLNAPTAENAVPRPLPWFWLLIALPPLILALGPDLTLGQAVIPLPYLPLHDLLGGQYRQPIRFIAPAMCSLITFAALAWMPFVSKFKARHVGMQQAAPLQRAIPFVLTGAFGLLILLDSGVFAPFPIREMPDYALYHQIAQEGDDFVIFNLPVGTHSGWTGMGSGQYAMFYGPDHQHRMINGTFSRVKYSDLAYYFESPLYGWLAGGRELDAEALAAAGSEFANYLREYPIGYVAAHMDWIPLAQRTAWIGWFNEQPGLCAARIEGDAALVWWRAEARGCDDLATTGIALGQPEDWLYIGQGWYEQENIGGVDGRWAGERAALRVMLDPGTAYDVTFTALPFQPGTVVTLGGSGEAIALGDGWGEFTVTLPAGALEDGRLLTLEHNHADSPAALGLSDDTRLLAVAYGHFSFQQHE